MTDFKIETIPFDAASVAELSLLDSMHRNWPVVYTLSNETQIYVGETVNASNRMAQHLSSDSKKKLKQIRLFLNEKFNKSACLDLEAQLIRLFAADEKFQVLNSNLGISDANYYDKDSYGRAFDALFEELRLQGWLTRSVPELINTNLFKYSPFKSLNAEQAQAVAGILDALIKAQVSESNSPIVIEGDPGTGKTIVAIYLIKLIHDISKISEDSIPDSETTFAEYLTPANREIFKDFRIGLVIPQQALRSTLSKVFSKTPGLSRDMILTPFAVGKSLTKWDLLIVDETHRLGMRAQQPHPTLNIAFAEINLKLFGRDENTFTQLDWVKEQSSNQVLLLDAEQSIKPADLPRSTIDLVISEAKNSQHYIKLASQMRVQGGEDYIQFVRQLFTSTPVQNPGFGQYDLRFFDSFEAMSEAISKREEEVGLARLLAGYAWDWVSKKNPSTPDIHIEGATLFWNRTDKDWINSKTSAQEVGSIHTIQGYDLNYAGVIIGPDLSFDKAKGEIVFNRNRYFDANGKVNNKRLGITYSDEDIQKWVINIYRVLLTRGVKGTYVYVYDTDLREHIKKFFN